MRPHKVSAAPSVAPNTTLPLWMYVTTSSRPCFSKQVLSAVILMRLLPPTLIPRNSATYRFMIVRLLPYRPMQSERLAYRPIEPSDLDAFSSLVQDPHIR